MEKALLVLYIYLNYICENLLRLVYFYLLGQKNMIEFDQVHVWRSLTRTVLTQQEFRCKTD